MGRSVSYHGTPIIYLAGLTFADTIALDDDEIERNEDGDPITDYYDFSEFIDDIRTLVQDRYPSFEPISTWPGREDHAILSNGHALFGISQYCDLISVWIAPNNDAYPELASSWIDRALPGLRALLVRAFPSHACVRVGTASSGESFYREVFS